MTTPAADPAPGTETTAFPHGVASGDVDQTSVTIWTRLAAWLAGREVEWFVEPLAATAGDRAGQRSGTVTTGPERDHTIHVTVDGLAPGTDHRFGFRVDGVGIEGRTRTLPDRADELRFVVACCSRWGWPGFERYGAIVEEEPAFVLHLGDYIYETGGPAPDGTLADPPYECVTLEDYRRRYRLHRSDPGLQRLHSTVPFVATWDDHEVANNAPGPEPIARRLAGQQAWREWLPMRRRSTRDTPPTNDRWLSVGGLFDLALLDTRYGGRNPADTDGPAADPDHGAILDQRQWRRLSEFVPRAEAPWLLVGSQVQVGSMVLGWLPAAGVPPWRRLVNPDQWDGHPVEQEALFRLLAAASGQPVILSGDLHSGWARTLHHDDRIVAHELTAPSISGLSYGAAFRRRTWLPSPVLAAVLRLCNQGIDLLELNRHGYLVCDVTPEAFTVTFVLGDGRRGIDRIRRVLPRAAAADRAEGSAQAPSPAGGTRRWPTEEAGGRRRDQ